MLSSSAVEEKYFTQKVAPPTAYLNKQTKKSHGISRWKQTQMCACFCQISENSVNVDYTDSLKISGCDFTIQLIGSVDSGVVVAD